MSLEGIFHGGAQSHHDQDDNYVSVTYCKGFSVVHLTCSSH